MIYVNALHWMGGLNYYAFIVNEGLCLTFILSNGDTSWPKQSKIELLQATSKILYIEYLIVCCIETYLIHIYHMSKCSKCNWNRYIEIFCMWNEHFHINGLSPNIACVILMSWPLMTIYFLLLTISCAVFIYYEWIMKKPK